MPPIKIRAYATPWNRSIAIGVFEGDNRIARIEFHKCEAGANTTPTVELTPEQAQTLMDDLWNCGIRPTEGTGSAGSLAATRSHLEDMRAIAFNSLEVEQPCRTS